MENLGKKKRPILAKLFFFFLIRKEIKTSFTTHLDSMVVGIVSFKICVREFF